MQANAVSPSVLLHHPDLGRIYTPQDLVKAVFLPGRSAPRRALPGEYGVVVGVQKRPVRDADGHLTKLAMIWHSISHNERVDQGAVRQDLALFGSTSMAFTVVAVANAALTKTKSDLGLGQATGGATVTNEYTASGLARAAGTLGTYTAPSSLGGTFSRVISKTFTPSASVTAYGSGLFDSTTPTGSNLYVEDNFASNAVLVNGDTLAISWAISN